MVSVKTSFQDTTTHLLVHRLSSNQVFPQQLSVKGEVPKSSFIFQLLLLLSTLCSAQRTPSGTLTNQQFLQVGFENDKNDFKHFLITYFCQGFRSARRSTDLHTTTTTTTAELHTTTELYSTTATELHTTATELYHTTRFSPTAAPTTRPDPTAAAAACRSYSTTTTTTTELFSTTAAESTPVTLSTTTTTAESTSSTVPTTTTEPPFPPAATTADKLPATASSHFSAEWLSAAGCSCAWHYHK